MATTRADINALGGLIVGLLGLRGFLPMSQVAPDAAADWKALVGKAILVEVLEVNRRRNRVIVRQVPPTGPAAP